MADSSARALVKRIPNDVTLMPPPPLKRIKRPNIVLEEDEYTAALSEIITRDYFPGLYEIEAQHEYLAALDSRDDTWIAEAGRKLREAATPRPSKRRQAHNTRFNDDVESATPQRSSGSWASETPLGHTGAETPISAAGSVTKQTSTRGAKGLDTSRLSLGAFQAKYTSEDNESFNTVLAKHNEKTRTKNAHLWTQDQRIPSARQLAHRAREAKLIKQKEEDEAVGKSLIALTSGATDSRPAKPDTWNIKRPDNSFMFNASSVDQDGIHTVQEVKEQSSKAGPKQVVYSNTRFPPLPHLEDPGAVPPSPSLNTDIITRRDANQARRGPPNSTATEYDGSETPRVNGYAFVDEDEPENIAAAPAENKPSYRDLLAGQVGDGTANPFKINEIRKREDLHLRMVEKQAKKARDKERDTRGSTLAFGASTPGYLKTPATAAGNMTPAARRLMEKLGGRTPKHDSRAGKDVDGRDMWTPSRTPRKSRIAN
ncbi:uncharacterized protein A1O9_02100 [Exophiala aquamarina CBS 119918]|uniref:Nuclear protein DGCR14 n=1 Tax=Exophiala aquamarina CBS 119918 TaxID=1182545 RepID=A0A072PK95_9EURO|nr:uncharacterized protein A1O9_02100 [Exophiala aquamarina CBS 119918]KEF60539.1 hypothetical protein A1O9_02100 [Exophiala aquamarina CBS 119918]